MFTKKTKRFFLLVINIVSRLLLPTENVSDVWCCRHRNVQCMTYMKKKQDFCTIKMKQDEMISLVTLSVKNLVII